MKYVKFNDFFDFKDFVKSWNERKKKPKYWVEMKKEQVVNVNEGNLSLYEETTYVFYIISLNSKPISSSNHYKNKAQARNIGKRFAKEMGLEWRE